MWKLRPKSKIFKNVFCAHCQRYRPSLGLQSLEHRDVFNDLVLCYKIKNVLIDTDIDFIVVNNLYTGTCGHSNKLMKQHCTIDATKFYFSNRVISIWNSLSEHIVSAPAVSAFKNRLFQFKSLFDVIFMCNAWFLFLLFHFLVFYWLQLHVLFALCFYWQCKWPSGPSVK